MINNEDFRLSVSKTKTFIACKKQYEYTYILKFPKKERDYHILGTFAHKVLENFHNTYLNGTDQPFNKVMSQSFKDACTEYSSKITPAIKKECRDIIDSYLKLIYTDKSHVLAIPVIACEKNFSIKLRDNLILNGMIDRIQLDSDGILHVADYKTTKNKKYLKNDFFQLLTYCYALAIEDPSLTKIRASYILLRHNFECITTEFSREDILNIRNKYIAYADEILAEKEFAPNPTVLCNWCDHKEHCNPDIGNFENKPTTYSGVMDW